MKPGRFFMVLGIVFAIRGLDVAFPAARPDCGTSLPLSLQDSFRLSLPYIRIAGAFPP